MTRNGKILAGAALVLALGSVAAVAHRGYGHHRGHHGGFGMGMGFAGPMGRICSGDAAEKADFMLVRIEHRVKPTDAQKPAFEEFRTAVKSAAGKVAAACPADARPAEATPGDGDAAPKPRAMKEMPARLADAETQLTAALDALKTVRPAAEKLYASLDDAQKKAVSEMGAGRHGKEGKFHHRRWDRDDGEGPL